MPVTINASTTSGVGITSDNSGAIQFQSNAANTVTIDTSGNVGIGTASPTSLLNIYNATSSTLQVDGDSATNIIATRYSNDFTQPTINMRKSRGTKASPTAVNSGDAAGFIAYQVYGGSNYRSVGGIYGIVDTYTSDTNISGYLAFYTNGGSTTVTERMRIDSSGNVGIGTTSPASFGKFAVTGSGGTVFVGSSGQNIVFTAAGTNYITTQTAGGQIQFQTGAGSNAMLIDSSGNVGIGTTSPQSALDVTSSSAPVARFQRNSSATNTTVTVANLVANSTGDMTDGFGPFLNFQINDTANSEQTIARILAIRSGADNSGSLLFATVNAGSNLERMRIDSSGYVYINETATQGTASYLTITAAASTVYGATIKDSGTTYATTTRYMNFVNSTNAVAGSIQHTAATTTAFSTSSDARLKKNIVDAPSAINIIANIPVRSYDWKEDNSHVKFGFVAQELGQVYEEPVGVGGDDVNANPWSIEYGRMTPILVKALQELKSEFDAYKATHP